MISIVTPARIRDAQEATWLREAADSVLAQTFTDWEWIIVDDASVVDVVDILQLSDARIHTFRTDGVGASAARNHAAHNASGELLLPLDADDKLTPETLAKMLAAWNAGGSEKGIVYSDIVMFGQDVARLYRAPDYDFNVLLRSTFMSVGCLHRKADWERVGGWRHDLEIGLEDWDYWITLGEQGVCGYHVAEVLYYYRINPNGRMVRLKSRDWNTAYQRMRELHRETYNGRYPAMCCGSPPKGTPNRGQRFKTAQIAPLPDGTLGQVRYVGKRTGDFWVAGSITRVRYHVPGKNMLVEDAAGKPGVDLRDIDRMCALDGMRSFRRESVPQPTVVVPQVAAPAPAPISEKLMESPAPSPVLEALMKAAIEPATQPTNETPTKKPRKRKVQVDNAG